MAMRTPVTTHTDAIPPIWREAFWPADWLSLRLSSVYRGSRIPRGDGGAVVVVPGFMCTDAIMAELHGWLRRIGYQPYLSNIGLNIDCPTATAARLQETVERAHSDTGRRVRVIGHSLGGLVGRRVAIDRPEMVSQLVYLGSPIRAVHAHPAITATAAMLAGARSMVGMGNCLSSNCACRIEDDVEAPLADHIHHAAIYTRGDGVVAWNDAREDDSERNHEVGGTHIGLVYNPRAYAVLGELLTLATDRKAI